MEGDLFLTLFPGVLTFHGRGGVGRGRFEQSFRFFLRKGDFDILIAFIGRDVFWYFSPRGFDLSRGMFLEGEYWSGFLVFNREKEFLCFQGGTFFSAPLLIRGVRFFAGAFLAEEHPIRIFFCLFQGDFRWYFSEGVIINYVWQLSFLRELRPFATSFCEGSEI